MDAYAKVDNPTRRKMDEMLKTWKEPVPGSISTRPVFPPEYVRPIENALIGARNATFAAQQRSFQGQQQLLRRGPPAVPARETPTPPNARPPSHFAPPPFSGPNGQIPQDPNYPIRPPSVSYSSCIFDKFLLLINAVGHWSASSHHCGTALSPPTPACSKGSLWPLTARYKHRQAER